MLQAVRTQCRFLLKSWGARWTFLAFSAAVLYNFVFNVLLFHGFDVIGMYHPMRLLTLSYDHAMSYGEAQLAVIQLFPLMLCLPAGLSLAADQSFGTDTILICRLGQRRYYLSRILSVFLVTFLVISGPFFLEIILNCLSFPLKAVGDFEHCDMYDPRLAEKIALSGFQALYNFSPYLYALWKTVLFGLTAALLATVTAAFSMVIRVKYRVFLLLPVFALLTVSYNFGGDDRRWYLYATMFCHEKRQAAIPLVFVVCGLLLIVGCYFLGRRKDHLK